MFLDSSSFVLIEMRGIGGGRSAFTLPVQGAGVADSQVP